MKVLDRWKAAKAVKGLTGPEKSVLVALSFYANEDTLEAYPGKHLLAEDTGYCARTIDRAIAGLVAKNVIENTGQRGGNKSNLYVLNLENLEDKEEVGCDTESEWMRQRVHLTPSESRTNIVITSKEHKAPSAPNNSSSKIGEEGLNLLGEENRNLVMAQIKEYGKAKVVEALTTTILENPIYPKEYFLGVFKNQAKPKDRPRLSV